MIIPRTTALIAAWAGLFASTTVAGVFTDDFSAGVRSKYWTIVQSPGNIYDVDTTQGDVRFTKARPNPGGQQIVGLRLNLDELGGPLYGDFTVDVDFSGAQLSGGGVDQVLIATHYVDNSLFCTIRGNEPTGQQHAFVWTGSPHAGFNTNAVAGRLRVARVGSQITGYLDDQVVWGASLSSAAVKWVFFYLQNAEGSDDSTFAVFDNFRVEGATIQTASLGPVFTDDFATGLNPQLWTLSQSSGAIYDVDTSQGDVRITKARPTSGGAQFALVALKLDALGGPLLGNFIMDVNFSGAVLPGPGLDHVVLITDYLDGKTFHVARDNSAGIHNVHVWTGAYQTGFDTTATAGRFRTLRTASYVSAYLDHELIWTSDFTSAALAISPNFNLQNNLGSNDNTFVIFDDFRLEAANLLPTGACCYPTGSCAVTTEATCTGVWHAEWLTCAEATCPQPAVTIVYDVTAYIDGRDQLVIQGDTLRWHHFDYAAVGRHGGANYPTTISTMSDGAPVVSEFAWIPTWPEPPPAQILYEAWSSTYGLAPPLWSRDATVELQVLQSRGPLTLVQVPNSSNGFTLVLEYNDNEYGNQQVGWGAWYRARVTVTLAEESPAACCHADGTCDVTTQAECTGVWHAEWADCSAAQCPCVWVLSQAKISQTSGGLGGQLHDSDTFGWSVANLGDLDGDGIADLAVGAYQDDDGGTDRGAVWILFMNANGTVKNQQKISSTAGGFTGQLDNGDYFGHAVTALGDLDGDGTRDLAVGAHFDDDGSQNRGAVWILFLNPNGTVNHHQKISATAGGFTGQLDTWDTFGVSVASLGDLDADGISDLAVGAHCDDDGGLDRGAIWILFMNQNGTVRGQQKISATAGGFTGQLHDSDNFGHTAAALGDLDGDGVGDLVAGAFPTDDGGTERGAVWILFLHANGTVKGQQKISATAGGFSGELDDGDRFGMGVGALDDLDGDGIRDLAVAALFDDDGGPDRGAAWILFMNTDGTVKADQKISATAGGFSGQLDDSDLFGGGLTAPGDLDDDGLIELAVGAHGDDDGGPNRGAVWILKVTSCPQPTAACCSSDDSCEVTTQAECTGVWHAEWADCSAAQCPCVCLGDFGDDFEDSVLDPTFVTHTACGTIQETGGQLVLNKSAGCVGNVSLYQDQTQRVLCGDFDVQVEFQLANWTVPGVGSRWGGMLVTPASGGNPVAAIERKAIAWGGDSCHPSSQSCLAYFGTPWTCAGIAAPETQGRFRIVRTGATYNLYYGSATNWQLLLSGTGTTGDVRLHFYTETDYSTSGHSISFDNLSISSRSCTTGACCSPDGHCSVLTEADCNAADGLTWTAGLGCDPNPCALMPGDCDGDFDVDASDFADLASCLLGPGWPVAPPCDCFDLNSDGAVDLHDFAAFQIAFTGAPPANDLCANAQLISPPYPQVVSGTTVLATLDCPGFMDVESVWYEVELPYAVNQLALRLCGDGFVDHPNYVYYTACEECLDTHVVSGSQWNSCSAGGLDGVDMWWDAIPGPGYVLVPIGFAERMGFDARFDVQDVTPWACCKSDGTCVLRTAADCQAQGGTYQGSGVSCTPNPCPAPLGACCYWPTGGCGYMTEAQCFQSVDVEWHVGGTCTPNSCPQPRGACCLGDLQCVDDVTAADCTAMDGIRWFQNLSCSFGLCEDITSACCYNDGTCATTTSADCTGQWLPEYSTCTSNPCSGPLGACCLFGLWCTDDVPVGECAEMGGTDWHRDLQCTDIVCGSACCYLDGTCAITASADCTGIWHPNWTSCSPNPCPSE